MKRRVADFKERFSSGFAGNRYTVLEEVKKILGFNDVEWRYLFVILSKADGGYLEFNLGDISILFQLCERWLEDERTIHLSIEVEKDRMGRTATYEYKLKELETLRNKKQIKN
jgi:hypothetical protein